MHPLRLLILVLASSLPCAAEEATSAPSSKIQTFTGGWGKGSGSSSGPTSRLNELTLDQFKKTADLPQPVTVEILSKGRTVEGIEEIKERIVDIRITNPNPYTIFFQGRQYRDNKTIKPRWKKMEEGNWVDAGWDWCGTGVRDWDIEAKGSIEVMLYLHPELSDQQILGRFYRVDRPSMQSDCLLYEKT